MSCPLSKSRVPFFKGFRPSSAKALGLVLALVLGAGLGVGGCASSEEPPQDNLVVARLVSELEALKKSNREIQSENQMSGEQLALLKVEIASLKEQQATTRRQLDVVKRGARSGIYEDQGSSKNALKKVDSGAEKAPEKPLVNMDVPALKMPDVSKGRSAQAIPFENAENNSVASRSDDDTENSSSLATSARLAQPSQILADAQLKMQRANYGEAIVDLAQLQKDKPNFDDNGLVALLLAEAWLKIGQPENALPVLRSFYLKHPQSPDLLKAKMLEGRVLEKSGAREKALVVYREVLALGPETAFAREARTALGRMRDAR